MNSEKKVSIQHGIDMLESNGSIILTVCDWAEAMGYSRFHFTRRFKKQFGQSPKDVLKSYRMRRIEQEIQADVGAIGYKIATNVGLVDEKALHRYLSYHCGKTLRALKREILKKHKLDSF